VGKRNFIANFKILALSILVVLSNVMGNCLLNMGVKEEKLVSWASVFRLVGSPTLVAGVLLLITWMVLRMALLSTSPMTVVLPLTAGVGYVLTGEIGQFWFAEEVHAIYDYGLIRTVAGAVLVGTSPCSDAQGASPSEPEAPPCNSAPDYQT